MFIVMVGLQGGLFAVWPATYYGTSVSLDFALGFANASKLGPFGLYELAYLYVLLTMWVWPTETGYTEVTVLTSLDA